MYKVFNVLASRVDPGDYSCLVIVAENESQALEIAENHACFHEHQYPLSVEEIEINEAKIIAEEGYDI